MTATLELGPAESFGRVPMRLALQGREQYVARPCACGGTVWADPAAPTQGVKAHQATRLHREYRERQEA